MAAPADNRQEVVLYIIPYPHITCLILRMQLLKSHNLTDRLKDKQENLQKDCASLLNWKKYLEADKLKSGRYWMSYLRLKEFPSTGESGWKTISKKINCKDKCQNSSEPPPYAPGK